jgi:hypothetical protein
MYLIALFFAIVITLLLFIVGGILGWIISLYLNTDKEEENTPFIHPEFMDANGNIIPDEIVALRITPKLNIDEDYYDDADSNEEAEDYG